MLDLVTFTWCANDALAVVLILCETCLFVVLVIIDCVVLICLVNSVDSVCLSPNLGLFLSWLLLDC